MPSLQRALDAPPPPPPPTHTHTPHLLVLERLAALHDAHDGGLDGVLAVLVHVLLLGARGTQATSVDMHGQGRGEGGGGTQARQHLHPCSRRPSPGMQPGDVWGAAGPQRCHAASWGAAGCRRAAAAGPHLDLLAVVHRGHGHLQENGQAGYKCKDASLGRREGRRKRRLRAGKRNMHAEAAALPPRRCTLMRRMRSMNLVLMRNLSLWVMPFPAGSCGGTWAGMATCIPPFGILTAQHGTHAALHCRTACADARTSPTAVRHTLHKGRTPPTLSRNLNLLMAMEASTRVRSSSGSLLCSCSSAYDSSSAAAGEGAWRRVRCRQGLRAACGRCNSSGPAAARQQAAGSSNNGGHASHPPPTVVEGQQYRGLQRHQHQLVRLVPRGLDVHCTVGELQYQVGGTMHRVVRGLRLGRGGWGWRGGASMLALMCVVSLVNCSSKDAVPCWKGLGKGLGQARRGAAGQPRPVLKDWHAPC